MIANILGLPVLHRLLRAALFVFFFPLTELSSRAWLLRTGGKHTAPWCSLRLKSGGRGSRCEAWLPRQSGCPTLGAAGKGRREKRRRALSGPGPAAGRGGAACTGGARRRRRRESGARQGSRPSRWDVSGDIGKAAATRRCWGGGARREGDVLRRAAVRRLREGRALLCSAAGVQRASPETVAGTKDRRKRGAGLGGAAGAAGGLLGREPSVRLCALTGRKPFLNGKLTDCALLEADRGKDGSWISSPQAISSGWDFVIVHGGNWGKGCHLV